jgi:pimeloyl-ACP methyl ester carboxylesterase
MAKRQSLSALLLTLSLASQSTAAPARHEQFKNADISYGWARDSQSDKLRTFITRPKNSTGKLPVIFFVGWLSCDSVEYPDGGSDGFGAIFWALIEDSGYATVRMDKPGVGESSGDCGHTDFVDPDRVFVVGLSNGGGTSSLVPRQHAVRGYIAASSWGRTWYEHMLELERGRLRREHKTPAEIDAGVKAFTSFYQLYLIDAMTPGEALAKHPEWKPLWYDQPDGQYGRPAAFYQQLQSLNLGDAWQAVTTSVLVIHGTGDTIMSDADARAIADNVNATHPGKARLVEVPQADHLLTVNGKLPPEVPTTMLIAYCASPRSNLFKSSRKRLKTSRRSGVASRNSCFAWNTLRPSRSVSTPITSPMRQPGAPSTCRPSTPGTTSAMHWSRITPIHFG